MASRFTLGAIFGMLCAIWGSTWLVIRIGLESTPPFFAAAMRFALAVVVLIPLMIWRRSKFPRGRTEWALVAFVGVFLYAGDYGFIYWGEGNGVASGLSAVLFSTFVLQTAVAAHVLLPAERLTAQKIAGIGLGFAGILLIFRNELSSVGVGTAFPMLAIVLAATCAAVSAGAAKRWGHDTDPISFTGLSMVVGTAGLAAVSLITREPWSVPPWPAGILAIVYLALAGSVVTFVSYWWLLKRVEATTVSYIGMVIPIVAVLLGVTVGNEAVDVLTAVGATVTLAGIFLAVNRRLAAWTHRNATAPVADPPTPPT